MTGQFCPECGASQAPDGGPGCPCAALTARAADRTAEIRTAEFATAQGFDPLHIRPYVALGAYDPPPVRPRGAGPLPPLAVELPPIPPEMPPPGPAPDEGRHRAPRRGPFKAVAIGVTAAAVLGTAAFAGGMFPNGGHGDEAIADTPHTGLPDEPGDGAHASRTPATAKNTPARLTSASDTVSSAHTPSPADHQAAQGYDDGSLTIGDHGAQVVALQKRLSALHLYYGPDDGTYDESLASSVRVYQMYRHINGDPPGVYGPDTRRALESEQTPQAAPEPPRHQYAAPTTQHQQAPAAPQMGGSRQGQQDQQGQQRVGTASPHTTWTRTQTQSGPEDYRHPMRPRP